MAAMKIITSLIIMLVSYYQKEVITFLLWIDFHITAILVCHTLSVMLQFSHFQDDNELHNVNIVITLS